MKIMMNHQFGSSSSETHFLFITFMTYDRVPAPRVTSAHANPSNYLSRSVNLTGSDNKMKVPMQFWRW